MDLLDKLVKAAKSKDSAAIGRHRPLNSSAYALLCKHQLGVLVGRLLKLGAAFLVMAVTLGLTAVLLREQNAPFHVKSVDDYWNETGLKSKALEDVVDDDLCESSQRYFLACANALVNVADRLGVWIDPVSGEIQSEPRPESNLTEKLALSPWKDLLEKHPDLAKAFSFRSLWRRLVQNYIPSGKEASLTGAALNGFLSVFRDPHTYILPVDYYQEVLAKANSSSLALGIVLAPSEDGYFLRKVIDASPAFKAGLRVGDSVVNVNGVSLQGVPPQKMGELLKANEGEVTSFEILRRGKRSRVSITRSIEVTPAVTWHRLEGSRAVAVLTVHKFSKDSCQEVKASLNEMNAQFYRGLLLDLRDNSGGQMDEASCMVSLFMGPELPAFRIKYLDPAKPIETVFGFEEKIWTGKVAILMNGGTASASEILAGSLRDYERAILVGERSFGKGSFQEGETWSQNSRIGFFQTKGFYYLPSGYSPQQKGLMPDVPVKFRQAFSLRESDQYLNPLQSPSSFGMPAFSRTLDYGPCLGSVGRSEGEDPQLSQARRALFCEPVATTGGPRAPIQ